MNPTELDDIDRKLAALGVTLDEPDTPPTFDMASLWEPDEPAENVATQREHLTHMWGDPSIDLPSPTALPGYTFDRRYLLRYQHDHTAVPGQHRVTLAKRWRFERTDTHVLVPAMWVRTQPELWWCSDHAGPTRSTTIAGASVAAHPIQTELWDFYAAHVLEVTAPELDVSAMLGATEVAGLVGLTRSALATYVSRDAFPPPQIRLSNSPLWSIPPLGAWIANRRDVGRPRNRHPSRVRTTNR